MLHQSMRSSSLLLFLVITLSFFYVSLSGEASTLIFTSKGFKATSLVTVQVNKVNFQSQAVGTVIPFVALYDGVGPVRNGGSYKLLLQGDSILTGVNLPVSQDFTVGGRIPTVNLRPSQVIVTGIYQSSNTIQYAENDASTDNLTLTYPGYVLPTSASLNFPDNPTVNYNKWKISIDITPITLPSVNYIGSDVSGVKLSTDNYGADTVSTLTYIFTQFGYTAASTVTLVLNSVNLVTQNAGEVTPFIVLYNGQPKNSGTSYSLLWKGNPFSVTSGSTISYSLPNIRINLLTGQSILAGAYQNSQIIKYKSDSASHDTIIWNGNTIPPLSQPFPARSNWFFTTCLYRYNIAFTEVFDNFIGNDDSGYLLSTNNLRADTEVPLTYIFLKRQFNSSVPLSITLQSVNLVSQEGGVLTPFVALYNGGTKSSAQSYEIIATGSPISVPANSVVSLPFYINNRNPVISLRSQATIVAGATQTSRIIQFSKEPADFSYETAIWQTNSNKLSGTSKWFFNNQNYRFNIAFSINPSFLIGSDIGSPLSTITSRADTIETLTYIFTEFSYTSSASNLVTFSTINLVSQNGGTVTPFIALYIGPDKTLGTSYSLLLKGDPVNVAPSKLQSLPFTVLSKPASVYLSHGQTIVLGIYQSSQIVQFLFDTATTHTTLIWNGNKVDNLRGSYLPVKPNWTFNNCLYRINAAFNVSSGTPLLMTAEQKPLLDASSSSSNTYNGLTAFIVIASLASVGVVSLAGVVIYKVLQDSSSTEEHPYFWMNKETGSLEEDESSSE